ncbi:ABC transporter ATP-binding protein [Rhizobium mayense]|uniref:ABC transporter ATP-binding protein n=1 Tax=Rhizobium mayense TaxID=1312184 RepID=A0ABT7JT95_9HYPH|nr:ABC transporter ATP-binding protein [Rhizobium mayense]MDL2398943.1 ABC transporter ATP-binding protein [Rhizobium mayense]
MSSVNIKNVQKKFDEQVVLTRINLEVRDHEFLVLLGPSGCGKSTLLRMIAGLDNPSSGQIYIGGTDATRLPPKDRNIAMVFQNYALYPHLSVFENIAFPLRVRGEERAAIEKKVRWAAQIVEIERHLSRKPRQMSGGERQRTALARSLVREPAVFLLDEPLSNLDAKLRHTAREELRLFQERVGLTSVYVTHDQVEAMGLGQRIVVMDRGEIRQIGTPRDIYESPADTFVATFIGSPPMNIVDIGDRLLGFRPENAAVSGRQGLPANCKSLPVRIVRREYLGGEQLVYGKLDQHSGDPDVIIRLPSDVALPQSAGELARFHVADTQLRFFDPASKKAMEVRYNA